MGTGLWGKRYPLALAVSALLQATAPAYSQTAPPRLPTTGNPLQTLPQAPLPKAEPKVSTTVAPQQNPEMAALLALQLIPAKFEVSGVKSVPFDQVTNLFLPLAGKQITVADLLTAAAECTKLYRERGYALSFCYVPTQDFADGTVRVVAVEGYVARVNITGKVGKLERKVRAIAQRIIDDRPLRQSTFERYSQILGFLPGAKLNINVPAPTTTDGATSLDLTVDGKRYDATWALEFNHPGTQGLMSLNLNALTPLAEQWSLAGLYPDGRGNERFYSAGYSQLFGSDGWIGRVDGSRYRGVPVTKTPLPAFLDHRVEQDRVQISARYPLILANERSLFVSAAVYAADQSDRYFNTINGATLDQRSKTRVVQGTLDYTQAKKDRARQVSFSIARGLDAWGASAETLTNIDGVNLDPASDVSFTKYSLGYAQTRTWKEQRYAAVLRASGQYARQRLPSSEQISFGGSRFGLAYDPGETSGDKGWGIGLELSRSFRPQTRWLKAVTPYLVVQHAQVSLTDGRRPMPDKLGSVGVGVRLSDNKHFNVDFAYAKPTADIPIETDDRKPRWNMNFSYQLQ
ncbi:ShlB/FhaC/HecB family hemolysin secretion/activation protein [Pseudomonas sp. CGJS7]|uniref:ShlB/FhaC/HecB family hemolysin secretion/activation protein n=1 Tax=Pseudomonas sp. CGJS7 TaxID=3109348 RepID=UPI00300BBF22